MKKKLGRKLLVSALTASMVVSSLAGCGKKDSSKKAEQETKEKYEAVKTEKLDALLKWAQSLPDNPHMFRR